MTMEQVVLSRDWIRSVSSAPEGPWVDLALDAVRAELGERPRVTRTGLMLCTAGAIHEYLSYRKGLTVEVKPGRVRLDAATGESALIVPWGRYAGQWYRSPTGEIERDRPHIDPQFLRSDRILRSQETGDPVYDLRFHPIYLVDEPEVRRAVLDMIPPRALELVDRVETRQGFGDDAALLDYLNRGGSAAFELMERDPARAREMALRQRQGGTSPNASWRASR